MNDRRTPRRTSGHDGCRAVSDRVGTSGSRSSGTIELSASTPPPMKIAANDQSFAPSGSPFSHCSRAQTGRRRDDQRNDDRRNLPRGEKPPPLPLRRQVRQPRQVRHERQPLARVPHRHAADDHPERVTARRPQRRKRHRRHPQRRHAPRNQQCHPRPLPSAKPRSSGRTNSPADSATSGAICSSANSAADGRNSFAK